MIDAKFAGSVFASEQSFTVTNGLPQLSTVSDVFLLPNTSQSIQFTAWDYETPSEQLVITAIIALGDNAYGLAIQAKLSEYYRDKEVNLGSVYVTLERLEDKGYVSSKFSDPIPERGGRSRRLFRLLPTGQRALQESVSIQVRSQKSIAAFWRKLKWSPKG